MIDRSPLCHDAYRVCSGCPEAPSEAETCFPPIDFATCIDADVSTQGRRTYGDPGVQGIAGAATLEPATI